jgi:hypothetical protein
MHKKAERMKIWKYGKIEPGPSKPIARCSTGWAIPTMTAVLWDVTLCSMVDRNLLPMIQERKGNRWRHCPQDSNLSVYCRENVRFHKAGVAGQCDIQELLRHGGLRAAWTAAGVDNLLYGLSFSPSFLLDSRTASRQALLIIFIVRCTVTSIETSFPLWCYGKESACLLQLNDS